MTAEQHEPAAGDEQRPDEGRLPDQAASPQILEASEGKWLDRPPPDLEPHFRCIVHPRGSRRGRRAPEGTPPSLSTAQPCGGAGERPKGVAE